MADTTISTSTSSRDSRVPTFASALSETLTGWFGLDVRSLALLRIGLGLINFVDIAWRIQDVPVFYAGGGLLSSETAQTSVRLSVNYSLYFLDGSNEWATFVMVVHLFVTATLIFGYRSRTSAFLVWVLLLSLHNRAPLVLNGGDVLIRSLLFWCMFLPVGETWSLDAKLRKTSPRRATVVSPATAALVLQMLVLYFFAGFFKWNQDWLSGEALDWALRLETYNRPAGEWFVRFTGLTWAGTLATPLVETYLPLLWFAPGVARLLLWPCEGAFGISSRLAASLPTVQTLVRFGIVAVFAGFHLPIEILMWIGYFSYICWSGLIALLPTAAWERAAKLIPALKVSVSNAPWTRSFVVGESIRGVVAGLFLIYVLLWNVRNVRDERGYEGFAVVLPSQLDGFGFLFGLHQRWNMFQFGPRYEGWAAAHATLMNGEKRNILFREGPPDFSRPQNLRGMFPTDRWRKFFNNIGNPPDDKHAPEAALAMARRWNETHGDEEQIFSLDLYWLTQPLARDGSPQADQPVTQKLLARIDWDDLYGEELAGEDSEGDVADLLKALERPN
jgi:hypothetical protein